MKQTAVEWLEKELNYIEENAYTSYIDLKIKQALEMEKEQIVDAFEIGYENGACVNQGESIYHGHNYYNKTFKNTEQ